MAEDNPKIQIKTLKKPINNSREAYLAENEKNILGTRGFKFALGKYFSKNSKIDKLIKPNKFYIDSKIIPDISNYNKINSKLIKSNSQTNINNNSNLNLLSYKNNISLTRNQPLLRYKDNSIDIPSNNKYNFSLFSPKSKKIKTYYSDNINIFNLKINLKLSKSSINNLYKRKSNILEKKFKQIHKFNGLKTNDKKYYKKSYFKGVESVFIYPEQIYCVLKDYKKIKEQKDSFDAYENNIKEKIEQNNEFKEDQKSLLLEEKVKENLINSKDFHNYLINREYFYQTQLNKKENLFKENYLSEEKENFKNKMNYLKKIAFKKENSNKNNVNWLFENNIIEENNETNSSKNDDKNILKKKFEDENIEKLRIEGKTYIFKEQMNQIARKILNKCKVYNELK